MKKTISYDLRQRIVAAYKSGLTGTYEATAEMFSVGRATVSRLLRRDRETGDVVPKPRGGDLRRAVDLQWLSESASNDPDARLVDRIEAYESHSGRRVSVGAMWNALSAIGWTHKKRRLLPANGTDQTSSNSARRSAHARLGST